MTGGKDISLLNIKVYHITIQSIANVLNTLRPRFGKINSESCLYSSCWLFRTNPPAHAWYKREGNKAVIGCEDNDKKWTVTCTGSTWKGEIGNCTESGTILNCCINCSLL